MDLLSQRSVGQQSGHGWCGWPLCSGSQPLLRSHVELRVLPQSVFWPLWLLHWGLGFLLALGWEWSQHLEASSSPCYVASSVGPPSVACLRGGTTPSRLIWGQVHTRQPPFWLTEVSWSGTSVHLQNPFCHTPYLHLKKFHISSNSEWKYFPNLLVLHSMWLEFIKISYKYNFK